jgi:hypothetical protein
MSFEIYTIFLPTEINLYYYIILFIHSFTYLCVVFNDNSVRREILDNVLNEFGIPIKLVTLIKMCLNEIYSEVSIHKYLSDSHSERSPLLFNFYSEYAIRKVQENK